MLATCIVACGSGDTSVSDAAETSVDTVTPSSNDDSSQPPTADTPATDASPETNSPDTETDADPTADGDADSGSTETPVTPSDPETEDDEASSVLTPPVSPPPAPTDDDSTPPGLPEDAIDVSGGDDDSPTLTESLSLQGPFTRVDDRPAGPPSSPQALTALMAGDTWVEFSWVPSVDDQSVEAYEIYRDGRLVYTVRGSSSYEFDYKSWITTSYIDCNYTRYTQCEFDQPASGSAHEYSVVAIDNEGMRSAPSQPVVVQLAQPQSGGVNLDGYTMVFEDNFDTATLDRSKWKTALPWGENTVINAEQQYFVNIFASSPPAYDPFVFTGSTLQITGIETPAELRGQANNLPYMSGVITTADYFEMTYGYVEMSARVAGGQGMLSTFYLFNQNFDKNSPEIDILEYIGSRPDKTYQTYHYYDSNRSRYASGEKHSTPTMEFQSAENYSSGFHTYAALWEPGLIVWYVDGQEVRRITGPRVSDEPMNIIAQLVIGSEWIGTPDPSLLPTRLEIDYIRAWQQK